MAHRNSSNFGSNLYAIIAIVFRTVFSICSLKEMQIFYAGSIKSSRMIGKELNRTKNEDTLEMEIVPLAGGGGGCDEGA